MRRIVTTAVLTVIVAALFLAGLIMSGRLFRTKLKDDPRFQIPMSEIECRPPPGLERAEFLKQVQYLAELPDLAPLYDDELPARLTAAFGRHAWVEKVESVSIGPGKRIRVSLTFRSAVLAVRLGDDWRAVDADSVLLPKEASLSGLPRLTQTVPPPHVAGQTWGNPVVESASRLAGYLRVQVPHLNVREIHQSGADWQLLLDNGAAVLWGQPPGLEKPGEATADAKRDYLLKRQPVAENLDLRKIGP